MGGADRRPTRPGPGLPADAAGRSCRSPIIPARGSRNWKASCGPRRVRSGCEIRLVEPSRDERHLAQLVELQLERGTWPGRRHRHSLDRPATRDACPRSRAIGSATRRGRHVADRSSPWSIGSAAAWGDDAVLRAGSPPRRPARATPSASCPGRAPKRIEGTNDSPLSPEQSRCRPFRLLGVPSRSRCVSIVPDGPPIRVTWQDRGSSTWSAAWGPERIATGWWRPPMSSATITARNGKTGRTSGSSAIGAVAAGSSTASSSDESCRNTARQALCAGAGLDLSPRTAPPVRYVELHCKTNFSFLEGASHPDELVESGGEARLRRAGHHRPQQRGGRGPRPCRGQEGRPQAHHRRRDHAGRCRPRPALGDEPRGLRAALPAPDSRPSPGPERGMPPRLRRRRRALRRPARRGVIAAWPATDPSETCRGGGTSSPTGPTRWPSCIAARATSGDWADGSARPRRHGCPCRRGRRALPRRRAGGISRTC